MVFDERDLLQGIDSTLRYEHDVFVSYSTAQEAIAGDVCRLLRTGRLATFFAPDTLKPSEVAPEQFADLLQEALRKSIQVVVLLSASYLDSAWCLLELHGAFGLLGDAKPRRLRILPIEPVEDRLIGQLVPFLFHRGLAALASEVRAVADVCGVRMGDSYADPSPPRMFVELPLRSFYEPPGRGPRPPWGKDHRSPHGVPGAPPYDVYERLVREYMVQIMRGRDPGRLEIPVIGAAERYAFMSADARRDAQRLIQLGVSPFQRPYTRSLNDWLRELAQARGQGQDAGEMDCLEGVALIDAGRFDEGIRLIRQGLGKTAKALDRPLFLAAVARAEHLARRFESALRALGEIEGPLPPDAVLAKAATLGRLGRISAAERATNERSDVSVDDIRIRSGLERRADLDFWAESLALAGYRL